MRDKPDIVQRAFIQLNSVSIPDKVDHILYHLYQILRQRIAAAILGIYNVHRQERGFVLRQTDAGFPLNDIQRVKRQLEFIRVEFFRFPQQGVVSFQPLFIPLDCKIDVVGNQQHKGVVQRHF